MYRHLENDLDGYKMLSPAQYINDSVTIIFNDSFFFFSFQQLSFSKDLFDGVSDVVKSVVKPTNRITPKRTKPKVLETVNVMPSGWIQFKLDISFKDGICFTKDMVSYWQIIAEG